MDELLIGTKAILAEAVSCNNMELSANQEGDEGQAPDLLVRNIHTEEKIYKNHERRLKYYYEKVEVGWIKHQPFFTNNCEYKKSVLVRDGFEALMHVEKTRNPADHAGLLRDYIKCLVRIQKSEKWIAEFEANKKPNHDRRCKARPKPKISVSSAKLDKEVDRFFKRAARILGMEAVQGYNQDKQDVNLGELNVKQRRSKSGGVIFEIIHE